jgi:hypothetical protein
MLSSSTYNVYKCLDNNSGANSTVEPTGTSTSIIINRRWIQMEIYVFTLTASEQTNFLSTDFMHVSTDSQQFLLLQLMAQ